MKACLATIRTLEGQPEERGELCGVLLRGVCDGLELSGLALGGYPGYERLKGLCGLQRDRLVRLDPGQRVEALGDLREEFGVSDLGSVGLSLRSESFECPRIPGPLLGRVSPGRFRRLAGNALQIDGEDRVAGVQQVQAGVAAFAVREVQAVGAEALVGGGEGLADANVCEGAGKLGCGYTGKDNVDRLSRGGRDRASARVQVSASICRLRRSRAPSSLTEVDPDRRAATAWSVIIRLLGLVSPDLGELPGRLACVG